MTMYLAIAATAALIGAIGLFVGLLIDNYKVGLPGLFLLAAGVFMTIVWMLFTLWTAALA